MSTLKTSNIQDTSGNNNSTPEEINQGRAKAWVNFNGTGTVAIRDSFNVSSITDNGLGDYSVNFSTSMNNANYAVVISAGLGSSHNFAEPNTAPSAGTAIGQTASSHRFGVVLYNAAAWSDSPNIHFAAFGD